MVYVSVIWGMEVVMTASTGLTTGFSIYPSLAISIDPATAYAYVVSNRNNAVIVLHNAEVVATIPPRLSPQMVDVDTRAGYAYVVSSSDHSDHYWTLSRLLETDVATTTAISTNGPLTALAVDETTGYIYAVNQSSDWDAPGTVTIVSGMEPIAVATVGRQPDAIAVDSRAGYVYVANSGDDSVSVISGTELIADIPVGDAPVSLAVAPSNRYVYVANKDSNNVSVIASMTVIDAMVVTATIPVGDNPVAIGIAPGTGYVYVVNSGLHPDYEGTVTIITGTEAIDTMKNFP